MSLDHKIYVYNFFYICAICYGIRDLKKELFAHYFKSGIFSRLGRGNPETELPVCQASFINFFVVDQRCRIRKNSIFWFFFYESLNVFHTSTVALLIFFFELWKHCLSTSLFALC